MNILAARCRLYALLTASHLFVPVNQVENISKPASHEYFESTSQSKQIPSSFILANFSE